jgi:hypothetical protein
MNVTKSPEANNGAGAGLEPAADQETVSVPIQ